MNNEEKNKKWLLIPLFMIWYVFFQGLPTFKKVQSVSHGRDFASFYYAQKVAWSGGDPYDSRQLSRYARKEKTRKSVHPYFYPPPALFLFSWAQPFSLHTASLIFFVINQLTVIALYFVIKSWLKISWISLGLLFALCTPIGDCIMMGQVNLIILFLITLGIQKKQGGILAAAAMIKMSPALLLWPQIIWKKWRFVGYSIAFAIIFSIFFLPIMGFSEQKSFYTDVLPQFSSGQYSGLKVPIHLRSNHSIPELCAQWFPAETGKRISDAARICASLIHGGIFIFLTWLSWSIRKKEGREKCVLGAFVVLMVLLPIYTYEHHLVFLILPSAILLHEVRQSTKRYRLLSYTALFFIFWPLLWWREAQSLFPSIQWWIQESKTFASLLLMCMLCYSALYSEDKRD